MACLSGRLMSDTVAEWIPSVGGQGNRRVLLPAGTRYRVHSKYWDLNGNTVLRLSIRGESYDVLSATMRPSEVPHV